MIIGTSLGFSNLGTVGVSVFLAFLFGYAPTSMPLLRAGLALAAVVPIALASDTFSIATMEVVDNLIVVTIPGALDVGVGDLLFWGSLSMSLFVPLPGRRSREPLDDRPRQGAREGARDRHSRRPAASGGGGDPGRVRRLRRRGTAR